MHRSAFKEFKETLWAATVYSAPNILSHLLSLTDAMNIWMFWCRKCRGWQLEAHSRRRFTALWRRNVLWSLVHSLSSFPCSASQCVRDTSVLLWFMSLNPFKFMLNHGPSARITVADFVSYSLCWSFGVRWCFSIQNKVQWPTHSSQLRYDSVPTHLLPA